MTPSKSVVSPVEPPNESDEFQQALKDGSSNEQTYKFKSHEATRKFSEYFATSTKQNKKTELYTELTAIVQKMIDVAQMNNSHFCTAKISHVLYTIRMVKMSPPCR